MFFGLPPYYYVLAAAIALVLWLWKKRWDLALLLGYGFLIFVLTVIERTASPAPRYKLEIFWSYRQWGTIKEEVLANIFAFVPIGFFAGSLWKWRGILAGFLFSLTIELLQLVTCRGLFEFDDIIHNTLGTLLGVLLYLFLHSRIRDAKEYSKRHEKTLP